MAKTAQEGTVYIIGAGFSKDLGYPLVSNLLSELSERLDDKLRRDLKKSLSFIFHPPFSQMTRSIKT